MRLYRVVKLVNEWFLYTVRMAKRSVTLPQVIGDNVKRIRGNHTLEELANAGRSYGATWSSGSLSAIERGDFKETIETITLLTLALGQLKQNELNHGDLNTDDFSEDFLRSTIGGGITIRDLLATDQVITLGGHPALTPDSLIDFLGGGSIYDLRGSPAFSSWEMQQLMQAYEEQKVLFKSLKFPKYHLEFLVKIETFGAITETERRLATKSQIDPWELRAWSVHLWGNSIEHQRNEVAGRDATPQKKGRVTRELLNEIENSMRAKNGND